MAPINTVYAARTRDLELLRQSSSGGIFTELARETLRRGGVVFGAAYDGEPTCVRHIAVRDEAGLARLRGSKYLRSDITGVAEQVCAELDAGRPVLFSGTPCQVAAVREKVKVEGLCLQRSSWLLLVEVVCHGVPRRDVVEQYLKDVAEIDFRDKSTGWTGYSVTERYREGYSSLTRRGASSTAWWRNAFMRGYVANLFLEDGCTRCPFKDGKSGADMTLGDYWNAESRFPEFADNKGVSVVIVHTDMGARAWYNIKERVQWVESDYAHAVDGNPAIVRSFDAHRNAGRFLRELGRGVALEKAVDRALRPWWRRLVSWGRNVLAV